MSKLIPLEPGHSLTEEWPANFRGTLLDKRVLIYLQSVLGKQSLSETWRHILWEYARAAHYEGPYPGSFDLARLQATPISQETEESTRSTTKKKGYKKTHARHTAPRRGETPQPTITTDTSGSDIEATSGQTTEALALV